jgi:ankyrin repeat protein
VWFGLVQYKYTPLHCAAENGDSESVQLLLAADSNPNVANSVSSRPCANIMELCGAELVLFGLVQGKCIPLHYAAMKGDSESVQLLLAADSNPNVEDIVGSLPSTNIYNEIVWC